MTLFVDYGRRREEYHHCTDVIHLRREEKLSWCLQTFKSKEWHYWYFDQRIYFKKQKHLFLFLLKWGI